MPKVKKLVLFYCAATALIRISREETKLINNRRFLFDQIYFMPLERRSTVDQRHDWFSIASCRQKSLQTRQAK